MLDLLSICLSIYLQNKAGKILLFERLPIPPKIIKSLGIMIDLSDISLPSKLFNKKLCLLINII